MTVVMYLGYFLTSPLPEMGRMKMKPPSSTVFIVVGGLYQRAWFNSRYRLELFCAIPTKTESGTLSDSG